MAGEQDQAVTQRPGEAGVRHASVVLNPVGGTSKPGAIHDALGRRLLPAGWTFEVYETTGDDNYAEIVGRAIAAGADMVVAAGGDGTVSLVAQHLVGTDIPLGIIPAGTANVLAGEIGLPSTVDDAVALLAGSHRVWPIDVMQVGDQYFILQIGIGLDSLMIRDTDREQKRRIGRGAYILTLLEKLGGHQSQRFTIQVDGKVQRPRAWQVLAANAGTLGIRPLRWGPNIQLDDGVIDLCVFYGRSMQQFGRQLWFFISHGPTASATRYFKVRRQVTIATEPPLPIQADGEIIGRTPLTIHVLPRALKVIAPRR